MAEHTFPALVLAHLIAPGDRWEGTIARDLDARFPAAGRQFDLWARGRYGYRPKLGRIHIARVHEALRVATLVCLEEQGGLLDEASFRSTTRSLASIASGLKARVVMLLPGERSELLAQVRARLPESPLMRSWRIETVAARRVL